MVYLWLAQQMGGSETNSPQPGAASQPLMMSRRIENCPAYSYSPSVEWHYLEKALTDSFALRLAYEFFTEDREVVKLRKTKFIGENVQFSSNYLVGCFWFGPSHQCHNRN